MKIFGRDDEDSHISPLSKIETKPMKTLIAYAGYFLSFSFYLFVCICCGMLAQSLSVLAKSQTSFSFSPLGETVVAGAMPHQKNDNEEVFDEYWRCPGCGGLVHPELGSCGCGYNR
jgi:hypothetical protein